MKTKYLLLFVYFFCFQIQLTAQKYNIQDSLRGSITKERIWWDLKYYNLEVNINPTLKEISGKNIIQYVCEPYMRNGPKVHSLHEEIQGL